jgi:hypothetical protein
VFKIVGGPSSDGYKAEKWTSDPSLHLWAGKCKVVAKGEECTVILEDTKTGKPFAVCAINTKPGAPKAVEKVIDSSRFFVLRIENQGKHAFIGIGFSERSEAFDFNVALQDHQKFLDRKKLPVTDFSKEEKKDYSMKEGTKIKVNLKVKTAGKERSVGSTTTQGGSGGMGGFNLEDEGKSEGFGEFENSNW